MLGDGGIVRTAVIAEYRLVDLFLAEHLSRVSGQMLADGVFAFRQRQRRITVVQRFGSQVEIKRTAPHAAGGYARLPPQMRRHTGAQLRHAKWLRQVIVAAKAQSAQIIADARSVGEAVKADITAQAQTEAADMIAKAKAAIEAEKKQAISELQATVADTSVDVAARLIGEDLTEGEHRAIIERYVKEAGSFNGN